MMTHHPDKSGHKESVEVIITALKYLEPFLT
jgi:hypothetical protein